MKNWLREAKAFPDETLGDAGLLSDLSDLYAAPVPALRLCLPAERLTVQSGPVVRNAVLRRQWRPLAVVGAVLAGVTVLLASSLPWRGETTSVSAETILQRTSDVVATNQPLGGLASYHLLAQQTWPAKGLVSTTEVWFADADHLRVEQRDFGKLSYGQSVDGTTTWWYATDGEKVQVVHGPASILYPGFLGVAPADSN